MPQKSPEFLGSPISCCGAHECLQRNVDGDDTEQGTTPDAPKAPAGELGRSKFPRFALDRRLPPTRSNLMSAIRI